MELTVTANVPNINSGDTLVTRVDPSLAGRAARPAARPRLPGIRAHPELDRLHRQLDRPVLRLRARHRDLRAHRCPWRTKPINVCFHAYATTKRASLNALKTVLDWSLAQPVHSIHASEHIRKVLDFNRISIADDGVAALHLEYDSFMLQ